MTGLKIVLPLSFTDTTLPKLRDDPVLPDTGALMLVDPTHPLNPWAVGVPGNTAPLPNLVAAMAAGVIGTLAANLQPGMKQQNMPSVKAAVERSSKGGLHAYYTIGSLGAAPVPGVGILPPIALLDYMLAHQDHDLYVSLWHRVTRATSLQMGMSGMTFNSAVAGAGFYEFLTDSTGGGVPASPIGQRRTNFTQPPVTGPAMESVGISAYTGTPNQTSAQGKAKLWGTGGVGPYENVANGTNTFSDLFYRFYMEDLTVSGRTYAAVDALDFAEYTRQVLTVGGRYYGDTFTDPATALP